MSNPKRSGRSISASSVTFEPSGDRVRGPGSATPSPEAELPIRARRRLLRAFLLVIAVLVVMAAGLYRYLSDPVRLASYTAGLLEDMTGSDAKIGSVSFEFDGRIEVRDVELRVPGVAGTGGELLRMEQVVLQVDPWQALRTRLVTKQMTLVRPVLSLTELDGGGFNYEQLREIKLRGMGRSDGPPELPWVVVHEGSLRVGELHGDEYVETGALTVEGRLSPVEANPGVYGFLLTQRMGGAGVATGANSTSGAGNSGVGPQLSGGFDLKTMTVEADVSGFTLEGPHRGLLPSKIRQWWDRLEPSGAMPTIRFSYSPEAGPAGELELDGLALTVPTLDKEVYRPRMTGVTGVFRFEADGIVIDNLAGEIEGLGYSINGSVNGYSPEAAFELDVRTQPFRIPEEPRFMAALPIPVQKIFTMLTPVGWMKVGLAVRRDEQGGGIDYEGVSTIMSGGVLYDELSPQQIAELAGDDGRLDPDDPVLVSHGVYFKFPYPLTDCLGRITFSPAGIVVEELTGNTPGGGSATIAGTIAPASPDAAIDLTVTAINLPFDQTLREALPPASQRGFEAFYNDEQYERLRAAGHFISSADHAEAEARLTELRNQPVENSVLGAGGEAAALEAKLALPVFDLGGRGKAIVHVTKASGADEKIKLDTAVELGGTNVLFEWFAYPIHVTGGRVSIVGDEILFDNVTATGLAGGSGTLNGRINIVDAETEADAAARAASTGNPEDAKVQRKLVPALTLIAEGLPLNELMYDVLPSRRSNIIKRLGLRGAYNIDGRILRNNRDSIDIDMLVELDGASASPGGGSIVFENLDGSLNLTLGRTDLLGIVAASSEGERLELSGTIDSTGPQHSITDLRAEAIGLRFERGVLDLIGSIVDDVTPLADFWAKHQPAGRFGASARFGAVGDDESYTISIMPRSLSFLRDEQRVTVFDAGGSVMIQPGLITLNGFSGTVEQCVFDASGTITLGDDPLADLSLHATGPGISPALRAALPDVVRDVLDRLKLNGGFEMTASPLVVRPNVEGAGSTDLKAAIKLTGASLEAGISVTELDGSVRLIVRAAPTAGMPHIELDLEAQKLRALNRDFESLTLRMHSTDSADHLAIPLLRGNTCEGILEGVGSIELDTGNYQIDTVLNDAKLAQLMAGSSSEAPLEGGVIDGTLSASLAIEGNFKRGDKPRGRGDVHIRDASLPGLPLALGLLNMTHLNLPIADRFKRARLAYYMRDGRFVFEQISLDSPTIRVEGDGRVDYETGIVDITLTTSNPGGLELGPLTSLINGLRDQLITIRVTGTTGQPQVSVQQLAGIGRAVEDVLGNPSNER